MVSGKIRHEAETAATNYRGFLLKISGEALMGSGEFGLDPDTVDRIAERGEAGRTTSASNVCLVIGGGNIFRGAGRRGAGHASAPPPTTWACWRR